MEVRYSDASDATLPKQPGLVIGGGARGIRIAKSTLRGKQETGSGVNDQTSAKDGATMARIGSSTGTRATA
jgi:hypothetical protein